MIYKIRDKNTGEYSQGGSRGWFNKTGKVFTQIGHLKNHLHGIDDDHENCEIVCYELIEKGTLDLDKMTKKLDLSQMKKQKERDDDYDKIEKIERKEKYLKLKREFEND